MNRAHLAALLLAAPLAATGGFALGQENKPIFKFPQAVDRALDAHINKRGNHPNLERQPPLRRIADPANLQPIVPPGPKAGAGKAFVTKASASSQAEDSGVPQPEPIKVAAQIKTQEDLKGQKIKGLKYLGTIGCGCYAKKYDIEGAFLEALEDCTEEVRLEAARAILASACADTCKAGGAGGGVCDKSNCCTKAIVAKLAEMAYKQDKDGCWLEPSERVRNAAVRALNACQQYLEPDSDGSGVEPGGIRPGPAPGAGDAAPVPPIPNEAGASSSSRKSPKAAPTPTAHKPLFSPRTFTISDETASVLPAKSGPLASTSFKPVSGGGKASPGPGAAKTKASRAVPASASGSVLSVDTSRRIVELAVEGRYEVPVGTTMRVYHRYLSGNSLLTELEVVESTPGRAAARPLDLTKFNKVARGDEVVTAGH